MDGCWVKQRNCIHMWNMHHSEKQMSHSPHHNTRDLLETLVLDLFGMWAIVSMWTRHKRALHVLTALSENEERALCIFIY